jgi:hypothetical protein
MQRLHMNVRNLPIRNLQIWLPGMVVEGHSAFSAVPDCFLAFSRRSA